MRKLVVVLCIAAAFPSVARAGTTVDTGPCWWAVRADPDRVNIAFPDEGAQYWATRYALPPGTDVVIRGTFPRARYISFNLYEGSMPIDAIADVEITPSSGGNPFEPGADRADRGTYEVRIVAGPRPHGGGAPNTLYSHGLNGEPAPEGTIIYRVYLPEGDIAGDAPLPSIVYETPTGPDVTLAVPDACEVPESDASIVNEQVRRSSLPVDSPGRGLAPSWAISRSRPTPTNAGPVTVWQSNVFYANFHNEYLRLIATRSGGDVLAFRAKAPTFPRTTGAATMPSGTDLRYWSICTNTAVATRYVACIDDEDMVLDADGYFTVVVSDVAHRPAGLRPSDNWLPAGPYADYLLIYRHMLPAPADVFPHAIQHAGTATVAADMGPYFPDTRLCTTAGFESDRCGLA